MEDSGDARRLAVEAFPVCCDAARAVLNILETATEVVNGQIFNIGSDSQNYQLKDLAELVAKS